MDTKLDQIIEGTRYRSSIRINPIPVGRGQYINGIRRVALWICRNVIVLESDSQWDDGQGRCIGAIYRVLDPQDGFDRDEIQRFSENWRHYSNASFEDAHGCDEQEMLLRFARRHAPAEDARA